ncbi:hypothetical protein ACFWYW_26900 [Nonomuraea sp. NPDC059023]|uniref:hypothetical protein n=1 Tax=unclassified Nonomuraea TaxID=2593643 RepID=UPI0036B90683
MLGLLVGRHFEVAASGWSAGVGLRSGGAVLGRLPDGAWERTARPRGRCFAAWVR